MLKHNYKSNRSSLIKNEPKTWEEYVKQTGEILSYGSSRAKPSYYTKEPETWEEYLRQTSGNPKSEYSRVSANNSSSDYTKEPKTWDEYQAQKSILSGKDQTYNSWIADFNTFSKRITNDYSERENTYQNPDEFGLYADEPISFAEELLGKTQAAKSFYTTNRDAAEIAYGDGSVDKVLKSLEEGEKYLQGIIAGLGQESDYWKKWESEEDWTNRYETAKQRADELLNEYVSENPDEDVSEFRKMLQNADLSTGEGWESYNSVIEYIMPDVEKSQLIKVGKYIDPEAPPKEITANYIEGIQTYYTDKREELDTLIRNAEQDPEYEELAMEYRSKFGGFDDIVVGNPEYERVEGYSPDLLHINVAAYYRQKGEVDKAIAVYEYNKTMKELDEQEKQKINAASQEVSAVLKSIEEQEGQEEFYSYIDYVQELDPLKIRKSEDYLRNVEAGKTAHVEPTSKYFITVSSLKAAAAGYEIHSLSGLTDEQINDALYFVGQEDYESAQYIIDGRKIEDIFSINAAISNQTADMEEEYASERGELDTYIDEALDDPDFQKIVDEYREKYGNLTLINQANYGAYEGWSPNDMHCKVADYYRGKGDHKKANAVFHYNETIPEIDKHWQKEIKNTSYLIEEEMIKRELEEVDDPEFEETANQYKVFDMYSLDSYNELEAEGEFEVGSLTMMGLAQDPYVSSDEIQDMSLMTKEQRQYYAYYMMTDKAKANQYLSVIRREMNARRAERMREDIAETAEKPGGRLLLAIQSIPLKLVSGISWIGAGIDSLGEYKPADPNAWYMIPAQMAAETRAGSTSNMGGVEQFFANAALSIADFAVAYFVTGGAGAMASAIGKATLTTLMATEAAGLATYDVLQRGGSTGEAFWTGTLVGGVEAATELISIGALDDAFKAIKKGADGTRIFQNIVRQGVAEGGEEVISEIGGNIADNLINGRNSNYYRYIDELTLGGKSREEARNLAQLKFFGSDLVLAFAGGALSGFAMGSGVSAYGHYSTQSKIDNMVATTLGWDESVYKSLPKDSKTYLREQFKTFLNKVSGDVVSEKLKLTDGISMSPEKVAKLTEKNVELANNLETEIAKAEARLSELNAINKPTQEQKTQTEQLTEQIKSDQIYLEVVNESIDEMKSKAATQQGQGQDGAYNEMSGDTSVNVGKVTTIRNPYNGAVPTISESTKFETISINDSELAEVNDMIDNAPLTESGNKQRGGIKNFFTTLLGGKHTITVNNVTFNGQSYNVEISNRAIGKVLSAKEFTPERISLLYQLDNVIKSGEYVGSGKYDAKNKKNTHAIRYDYFETPVKIGGYNYIAKFDVEVLQDKNRFRTYQINNIDLQNLGGYVSPELTSYENSANLSNNSIRSSAEKINSTNGEDIAKSERQSVQKLQPAEFKVGGAKATVKGIASVQSGKVTVELEDVSLAIADDMEFENKTQDQLYDKAKHFDTNAAKTFAAVYEANIPINDYFLGFLRIHGAARSGKTFEQAVQIDEYTAALPSHIQKAAYNVGAQAGTIADDASMKNATSVRTKTEQLRFNEWLKEHKTEVIAKKQKISERFKEAEANGDIAEMNKQLKEYKALEQWSEKTIRDKKAQIGKAVGGVVEYGGEIEVQSDKTGIGANATDIGKTAAAKVKFRQDVEDAARSAGITNSEIGAFGEFYVRSDGQFGDTATAAKAFKLLSNGEFKAFADMLDVSSPENKAVFWSKAYVNAQDYANTIEGVTLEMTKGGKLVDGWDWLEKRFPTWGDKSSTDQKELWKALSARYANNAKGIVTYVHPKGKYGDIWSEVELKILVKKMKKGLVTIKYKEM